MSKKTAAKAPLAPHTHTCQRCSWTWTCEVTDKTLQRCKTTVAAKVNKQGPWCWLCQNLITARHEAYLRGLRLDWFMVAHNDLSYGALYPKEP